MSECVSETFLLWIHRSRCCEAVSSKWWGKCICPTIWNSLPHSTQDAMASCVQEWWIPPFGLLLRHFMRHFIFSLATYHTTPRVQFYFIT